MSRTVDLPQPVEALLADGTTALIRPLAAADRAAVLELHARRMSPESQRMRFFGTGLRAPEQTAARLCGPRKPGCLALGAWVGEDLAGVVEYDLDVDPGAAEEARTAELAVAVADDWHHRGVATLLIEHLADAARRRGIRYFQAATMGENRMVHKVFADLGMSVERRWDGGELWFRVPLDESAEAYRSAVDERGRAANLASLAPLLVPRSVAVVGASRREGSVGQAVLLKIRHGGFPGELFAVNPKAARDGEKIAGEPAYGSVAGLPATPDLAVLAVPAARAPEAAEECGRAGVRALVVLASGLERQQAERLMRACRAHSMRLVGPNCLGIAQTDPRVRLAANFSEGYPLAGSAGVAVQSGGVGIALLDRLSHLGIGVSTFVSMGDKYDVSGNDLLQWWESDGRTDLALLHLESFGNPRAFSRTARRVGRRMPILTVDAGRSDAGRRAATSHSAAAATPTVTRRALFTQAGIIAAGGIGELVEAAALLHAQPLPGASGRVAVVSNAGGVAVLTADACAEAGLTVPELPAPLVDDLLAVLPGGASARNPVDVTAAVTADQLAACLDVLQHTGSVDAVLVCLAPTALGLAPGRALHAGPARRRHPVAAVLLGQHEQVQLLATSDGGHLPVYADPQAAARALGYAWRRARWLEEPPGLELAPTGCDTGRAQAVVERFLDRHPGGWLDPAATAQLLECYRLPAIPAAWAPAEDAAAGAFSQLAPLGHDGRVALKAYWPGQVHKSDVGAVRTNIASESELRTAYRDFAACFGDVFAGAVVQPMAEPGLELYAGAVQDEVFGPLILFGMGGTASDVLGDHVARLAPLTDIDVHAMITGLHATPLLFGHRGSRPVDLGALEDLLARLSTMATQLPQLVEADLNPVLARPDGVVCVDARLRLAPRRAYDPYLRRLRQLPGGRSANEGPTDRQ